MEIKILSPQWGHEHIDIATFLVKIKNSQYDGIYVDTFANDEKRTLFNGLRQHEMYMVSHQ